MKKTVLIILPVVILFSCKPVHRQIDFKDTNIDAIFLHHSTGRYIWYGDIKQDQRINFTEDTCMVPRLIYRHNQKSDLTIGIKERPFPSGDPYPWKNYPFDYYNIWVKNAGDEPYREEPTLELLTREYDMIIFKHCFPVSSILADDNSPDIDSEKKTLANYKLQYGTIKDKLLSFPETKFIVWTGAALLDHGTNEDEARRAQEFFDWVRDSWDEKGDNIYIFDFRMLETGGGLYLKPEFSKDPSWDHHPNREFSEMAARKFVKRIIEVAEI